MSIPVGAAVCGRHPVEVFGELTAIIGEDFFDPHAEHVLHGGEQPGRSSGRFDTDQREAGKQVNADMPINAPATDDADERPKGNTFTEPAHNKADVLALARRALPRAFRHGPRWFAPHLIRGIGNDASDR